MRLKAGDLLVELIDPALSKVLFAAARDRADSEEVALRVEEAIALKGDDLRGKGGWPARLGGSVAFGIEAGNPEPHFIKLPGDDLQVCAGCCLIEPHELVARIDLGAIANRDFGDNATRWMLYLLDIGVQHELARNDDGPR